MDESKLTITEHLGELRTRLIISGAAVLATTLVALIFSPQLLDYSVRPLLDVLEERSRVETVIIHPNDARAEALQQQVEARPKAHFVERVGKISELRDVAAKAIVRKRPIDLVMISAHATDDGGVLAFDVLDGIEPAPFVVYLVDDPKAPIVADLMLEGANVVMDPPRKAVVGRMIRRAAGAAGKSTAADKLVVLSPLEPFFAYLKIAIVIGLFLACPIWLWQAWKFVAPGLYSHEKGFVLPTVISGSALFVGGGAFAYFVLFPMMFDVLVNQMMPESLSSAFTVDKYLGLLLRMTVAFGVVFELPLAITLLSMVGVVTPDGLKKYRKYAVIIAFVAGALLTPADPMSQVAMALPLIIFYEIGIISSSIVHKRRMAKMAVEKDEVDTTALAD